MLFAYMLEQPEKKGIFIKASKHRVFPLFLKSLQKEY